LIIGFYDPHDDRRVQMESEIRADMATYAGRSALAYEIELCFRWETIFLLGRRDWNPIDIAKHSLLPGISSEDAARERYWGSIWLFDRDMLIDHERDEWIAPFIGHRSLRLLSNYNYYICCYGDTPSDGMRCADGSEDICEKVGCHICNDPEKLKKCRHTCYWYGIGLMLGAYHNARQHKKAPLNSVAKSALPVEYKYIYPPTPPSINE